jgi:hypothetical protein
MTKDVFASFMCVVSGDREHSLNVCRLLKSVREVRDMVQSAKERDACEEIEV